MLNRFFSRLNLWIVLAALAGVGTVAAQQADADDVLGSAFMQLRERLADGASAPLPPAASPVDVTPPQPAAGLVPIVIYHTNDIHGSIGPTPANPSSGAPAFGGAASLATLLKGESRPHLWLDSGDWFQGTPEGNLTHGDAVIAVLNSLKLTAGLLGNHDFDYGEANVSHLASEARFFILGSNITPGGSGDAAYGPLCLIKEVSGVKIGIFGLLTSDMPSLAFPQHIKGLNFSGPAPVAKRMVTMLRARGAKVVIAVTHLGIEQYGGKVYDGIKEGDLYLAQNVAGIDLILGGHTHTEMTTPVVVEANGGRTVITQTHGFLSAAYQIVLYVDPKTGALGNVDARLIRLDPALYPPDPDTAKLVAGFQASVKDRMDKPIGAAASPMTNNSNGESTMGNWLCDVFRRYGRTDIGIINTFGIRGNLPGGALTYGDIYKVMPFDNHMTKVSLMGAELRKVVERSLGTETVLLQYSGLEVSYNPKAPDGQRVQSITIGGTPLDDARVYSVTTMDFVANVDKGFQGIQKTVLENSPDLARDVLLKEVQQRSPITASIEGRIKAVTP
jgi:5'-nucleotidase / UDP-sugar diphosphatase